VGYPGECSLQGGNLRCRQGGCGKLWHSSERGLGMVDPVEKRGSGNCLFRQELLVWLGGTGSERGESTDVLGAVPALTETWFYPQRPEEFSSTLEGPWRCTIVDGHLGEHRGLAASEFARGARQVLGRLALKKGGKNMDTKTFCPGKYSIQRAKK